MTTEVICGLLIHSDSCITEYLIERLLAKSGMPAHVIESITDTMREMSRRIERLEEKVSEHEEISDMDDIIGALPCLDPLELVDVLDAGSKLLKKYQAAAEEANAD
jgi:hypothetical protein